VHEQFHRGDETVTDRKPAKTASDAQRFDPADPDKMKLPAGVTCGDCFHIRRCKAIFGHVETDTTCDWSPSRFWPIESATEITA
jgi:hypothetical protein